jgi:hypothetical protein
MERAARTPLHPLQHHDSTGMHDDQIMKDGPRAARILLTPGSKTHQHTQNKSIDCMDRGSTIR